MPTDSCAPGARPGRLIRGAGGNPHGPATDTRAQPQPPRERGPGPAQDAQSGEAYETEQFAFVEEQDEESQDVIDWLKFTESRTERREEARGEPTAASSPWSSSWRWRSSAASATSGMRASCPRSPGSGGTTGTAQESGPQNRDVIVVHLHNTKGGGTSTVLLVNNSTTGRGTTILLPNSLALSDEDGTPTTLAKSVADDGSSGTRESLDTLLGTQIQGTWRLDTPYLENLVELVGNIDVTTDTDVPDPAAKKAAKAGKGTPREKGRTRPSAAPWPWPTRPTVPPRSPRTPS